ncbi:MAG: hypothetical protein ACLT46_04705 [Hungatella sp.]
MKIADMTTRAFWKGEVEITGLVEDQGTTYKAVLGIKGSQINSCSCSCAQGYSYKGLCPHEKALFAHYKQQMNEEGGKTISTSSQVRAMIREYTNREVARIVQENEEGQVDFQPRLFISRQGVRAGFKVGRKRYYILKDLVSFAKAVETGAFVEYGKQLAFHHNEEIFREESRLVLRFVLECLETYQEHYEQFQRSAYTAAPVLRELPLSRGNMDRFFAMMRDQTLGRRLQNYSIPKANYHRIAGYTGICKKDGKRRYQGMAGENVYQLHRRNASLSCGQGLYLLLR